jgi:hypothetical protein
VDPASIGTTAIRNTSINHPRAPDLVGGTTEEALDFVSDVRVSPITR